MDTSLMDSSPYGEFCDACGGICHLEYCLVCESYKFKCADCNQMKNCRCDNNDKRCEVCSYNCRTIKYDCSVCPEKHKICYSCEHKLEFNVKNNLKVLKSHKFG